MKWQQGVQIEQEQTVELPQDWVEAYPPYDTVYQSTYAQTTSQSTAPKPGQTSTENITMEKSTPGEADSSGQLMKQDEQMIEALATEGRETRLQRDSEYFVSEEEALAQRLLKWQQDVLDQEEVVELESEWSMGEQHYKQTPSEPHDSTGYDPSKAGTEQHHEVMSEELYEFEPPAPYRDGSCQQFQDQAPTKEPSHAHLLAYGHTSKYVFESLPDINVTPAKAAASTSSPQGGAFVTPADHSLHYSCDVPIQEPLCSAPASELDRSHKGSSVPSCIPNQLPEPPVHGSEPGSAQAPTNMLRKSSVVAPSCSTQEGLAMEMKKRRSREYTFTVEECHEAAFTTAALCSRSLESLALASGLKMGGLTQTSF
jgi:hypothetical protein